MSLVRTALLLGALFCSVAAAPAAAVLQTVFIAVKQQQNRATGFYRFVWHGRPISPDEAARKIQLRRMHPTAFGDPVPVEEPWIIVLSCGEELVAVQEVLTRTSSNPFWVNCS